MRIRSVLVLLLIVILVSCKDEPETQVTVTEQVLMDAGFDTSAESYLGRYKRYTGKIAGQEVVLNMVVYGNDIHAEYYYARIGRNISLYQITDTNQPVDILTFIEHPHEADGRTAKWQVKVFADSIRGKWLSKSGDRTYDVLLSESYNETVQRFGVVELHDSVRFIDSLPTPAADFKYSVLLPIGNSNKDSFTRSVIARAMHCDSARHQNLSDCLQSLKNNYFSQYRELNSDLDAEFAHSPLNNWSQDAGFSVVYNENDFVVLDNHYYEYTGGAHGNYSSTYINIDRQRMQVLSLPDVLLPDTSGLLELLEVQARVHFGLNEKQVLSARMFNDDLHIPENFYIGSKGITFVYGLYEIASYADGIIELYIPYNKLTNMLTPAFKQRMQLEQVAVKSDNHNGVRS